VIGAAILGVIGLLFCALELTALVPYLLDIDIETFNPIKENLNKIYLTFEETLQQNKEEFKIDDETINDVMTNVKAYVPQVMIGATIESGVYGLICLLMVIGAASKVRLLMLPYLIINLIGLIVMILGCVGGCVALFFYSPEHVVMGVIASVITLILAILLIYFWSVVQRAFVELGNDDRMYSPVPMKPAGNYNDGRGAGYYPTSPQHFQMDERK
jgi:hypothetical protein